MFYLYNKDTQRFHRQSFYGKLRNSINILLDQSHDGKKLWSGSE